MSPRRKRVAWREGVAICECWRICRRGSGTDLSWAVRWSPVLPNGPRPITCRRANRCAWSVHLYVHLCKYVHSHVYSHMHSHVHTCISMHINVCTDLRVKIHIGMHTTDMKVCEYTFTHVHADVHVAYRLFESGHVYSIGMCIQYRLVREHVN